MLVRIKLGAPHDGIPGRLWGGPAWSFNACLAGRLAVSTADKKNDGGPRGRTLWVFPTAFVHAWAAASARVERAAFDFTEVPPELQRLVPARGYYRVALSPGDCRRLRVLAELTLAMAAKPTELLWLHNQNVLMELSMMALREVTPRPLAAPEYARIKTEEALAWYDRHMDENPGVDEIARAECISESQLRRLFRRALGESPHVLLNRRRMERVEALLRYRSLRLADVAAEVGFSSVSALSRAVKAHFGLSPREMRKRKSSA